VGEWSGEQKRRTITVNAAWSDTLDAVIERVTGFVTSDQMALLSIGSEPMSIVSIQLIGGALLALQQPTITMPNVPSGV
jgi:hypothetical protein